MLTYYEFITEYLEELEEDELLEEWNEYCSNECMDNYIYYNDEYFLDEYFEKPSDAVRAVYYGNFNYMDTYIQFNGYANLDTSSYLDDLVYISDLASYLEGNGFLEDEYYDYIEENEEV